jgi:hypothetical protein
MQKQDYQPLGMPLELVLTKEEGATMNGDPEVFQRVRSCLLIESEGNAFVHGEGSPLRSHSNG